MSWIANGEFPNDAYNPDSLMFKLCCNFMNLIGINRFNFPTSVVDGTRDNKILGIGAELFRIESRPA